MEYDELTEEQIEYTNYEEELTRYILDEQQKQIEEIKKEQDKSKDYLFLRMIIYLFYQSQITIIVVLI